MPIGITGVVRIERLQKGESFQCSCGAGKIDTVETCGDGDYRATCVCKRTIRVSMSGAYTPAYPPINEVASAI